MKDECNSKSSKVRNLFFTFLIRTFCGPLGKGVWQEFPDLFFERGSIPIEK
jgi:hypothetical protein